jgi:hypothetical protein
MFNCVTYILIIYVVCTYFESLCFKILWYTCKAYKTCFQHFVILDKFPSNYVSTQFVFTRSSEQAKRAAMVASLLLHLQLVDVWSLRTGWSTWEEHDWKYFHMRGSPPWTTLFISLKPVSKWQVWMEILSRSDWLITLTSSYFPWPMFYLQAFYCNTSFQC